jgi:hypothetical protein
MPFTIPNTADASDPSQAQIDKVDFDILIAGDLLTGVISGCAVTAQGAPDMTVAVAAGSIAISGVPVVVTGGNVTITAANATNPRFDLVVVDNTGVKSATAGVAAAVPIFPAIPANSVVLAAVFIPANDTAINANQIVDKRVLVQPISDIIAQPNQYGFLGWTFPVGPSAGLRHHHGYAGSVAFQNLRPGGGDVFKYVRLRRDRWGHADGWIEPGCLFTSPMAPESLPRRHRQQLDDDRMEADGVDR